ncbi:hypothetical protein OQX61_23130 [Pedobacter sp. PLR]|uniref:hypothetical protein n=1 Tax=Pedobacter sp. PLR TaxID=2994465 RepID=UPI002247A160|nr:hypothetical protein [Pedobacter sp. PLR]MCX2454183.1 hypothetical protein [Pedobacter sp. PLR]
MKKLVLILMFSPIYLFACSKSQQNNPLHTNDLSDTSVVFNAAPTKIDVEKILGQSAGLTDQKKEIKDNLIKRSLTYTSLENEPETNRTVNLNYILTKYADSTLARNAYDDVLKSNHNMSGQTSLIGIGNEAWYHSDNENFSVIIVRKGDKLLLMKINKMTRKFSMEELKKVTKRIVSEV